MAKDQRKAETKPSSIKQDQTIKKATKLIQARAQVKTPPKSLKCISYTFFSEFIMFSTFSPPFNKLSFVQIYPPFGNELIKETQKDAMHMRSKLESFTGYVNKYLNML